MSRAARYLYLARHAEASADESGLTERGRAQAAALGRRLRGVPLAAITHGPLPRAAQTAELVATHLDRAVPTAAAAEAGDYVPYLPDRAELPAELADTYLEFLAGEQADQALASAATRRFTGPVDGDQPRHELVVTHAYLVGWLVRDALTAPAWRWLGLNPANAALTVIRYGPGRLPGVLVFNDLRHLDADLAWTGFPPELSV